MSEEYKDIKPEAVDTALGDMHLEEEPSSQSSATHGNKHNKEEMATSTQPDRNGSHSLSPEPSVITNKSEDDEEDTIDGEIELKIEPGKLPKLSRKSSQKVVSRPPPLFDHLPNSTEEATATFQVIRDCIYGSKYMGSSEHDALGCDCSEQWSKFFELRHCSYILTFYSWWPESCLWRGLGLH